MTLESLFEIFGIISILSLLVFLPRFLYFVPAFKKAKRLKNPNNSRLAVLVPARNESAGIRRLLDSLAAQTYDSAFFDTFVIVQSADDPTCQIAAEYKNTIVKIVSDQKCKGEALDGCLKDILRNSEKKYDGYIIVDADNVVDTRFVEEMNNSLACDRQIILGKREVKNWIMGERKYRNWAANCSGMIYTILDKMGNVYRSNHGISCTMCGTGIMVRHDVIEQLDGWPYRSQTEDLEMTVDALIKNWSSYYYEYAITYTEEPLTLKDANRRRQRWLRGFMEIAFKYRPTLTKQTFASLNEKDENGRLLPLVTRIKNIKWKNFDYLYSLAPAIVWVTASIIFCLIYLWIFFYGGFSTGVWNWKALMFGIDILMIAYAALMIYTFVVLLVDRKAIKVSFAEKVVLMFMHPLFIAHYLYLFVFAFLELLGILKTDDREVWKPIGRIEQ